MQVYSANFSSNTATNNGGALLVQQVTNITMDRAYFQASSVHVCVCQLLNFPVHRKTADTV